MSTRARWSRLLLIILPLLAVVFSACGVLKPVFSHQGRLLDASGNPVPDGNYEIVYSIYISDTMATTESYSETQVVAVQDGLFTTSVGLSNEIDPLLFSQQTWLGLTVNGEELAPRQRMQGAPFAFSLVSGAVVMGDETRLRTLGGDPNAGASLTVYNRDGSATGGHGLVVVNEAEPAGANRQLSAALVAVARGGNHSQGNQNDTGSYGAILRSDHFRGMYVQGAGSGGGVPHLAALFNSEVGIQIEGGGNCIACTLAYIAVNIGQEVIEPGDFVVVMGVEKDADLNMPVMQVRKATAADTAIVGVATGAVTRKPVSESNGMQVGGFEQLGGPAASDSFVNVVVQGLVEARVGQVSSADLGRDLQSAAAAAPAAGRLMSVPEGDGLAWVMLGGS